MGLAPNTSPGGRAPTQRLRPIVVVTFVAALAALALVQLAPPWRVEALWTLAGGYAALATWGSLSMRSGLFGRAVCRATHGRPEVALTFDDGPDPAATPALLDLLAARGVQATFFCVGARARAQPELVRDLVARGHLLGNHSDRHAWFTNFFGRRALRRELARCQETLGALSGSPPRYYRPPVGLMSPAVAPAAWDLSLELVGWDARSYDTTGAPVERIVARVLRAVTSGSIVLLHDGGQEPERALAITRGILDGLAARGLRPVRLDALLRADPVERGAHAESAPSAP